MPFQNQKKFRTENTEYTERTQREHREMPWGCLGRRNFIGHRGVTEGTPRYNPEKSAFPEPSQRNRPTGSRPHELSLVFSLCPPCPLCEPCFSRHVQTRIASPHKEGTLTPRCPTVRVTKAFSERQTNWKSVHRVFFSLFSVFSVPSVRTLVFDTCTKAYRALCYR